LSDSNTVIFGAVNDGNLIGSIYVLFKSVQASPLHVPRSIGLIDVLVVAPEFRSVGVGAALVKEAQQWAKKKGANQMEINVWEFNSSALEFYENQGYRTFSRKLSLSI
jgi:GNAT superfamily N-acetyltransferase